MLLIINMGKYMKHRIYFLYVLLIALGMSNVCIINVSCATLFDSEQKEQHNKIKLLLYSWNVQNLDYDIHMRAKAYEKGLNARWNFLGKMPRLGEHKRTEKVNQKTYTIFGGGYLMIRDDNHFSDAQCTIIPYGKYDPFYDEVQHVLIDKEHNYLHIAGKNSSFISVSFDDYTCVPSPLYRIFRKGIVGDVTKMYYYKEKNFVVKSLNWLATKLISFNLIKDGLEQSCLAIVANNNIKETVPLFHSSVLKVMAIKRKQWNSNEMLALSWPYLWISVKLWLCGFFDLEYTMPNYKPFINVGVQQAFQSI